MIPCTTCGVPYKKDARFVGDENFCSQKCNPIYSGFGDKLTLVRSVAEQDNDPAPQVGYKLSEREWLQFRLPSGCVLRNDRNGKLYIVNGCAIEPLSPSDYIDLCGPVKSFCGGSVYSTGTAWHDKRAVCPGQAWEA